MTLTNRKRIAGGMASSLLLLSQHSYSAAEVLSQQTSSSSSSSSSTVTANELLQEKSRRIHSDYDDEDSFENRVLGQNYQNQYGNQGSWLDDYSLKFLGCDASSNYARFRLCPLGACWNKDSLGCRKNYGDYAIDMQSYVEAMMTLWDGVAFHACNRTAYKECSDCFTTNYYNEEDNEEEEDNAEEDNEEQNNNDDYQYYAYGGDDDDDYYYYEENDDYTYSSSSYNANYDDGSAYKNATDYESRDECLYSCLHSNSVMPSCYYVLTEDDYFIERYNCGRLEGTDYYLGPYCGEDGSGIYIGLFQDEDCRYMVNDASAGGVNTWKSVSDDGVAFTERSRKSLQFRDCLRCQNLNMDADKNSGDSNENDDDNFDGTACDAMYQDQSLLACEVKMKSDNANTEDDSLCYEINSIPLPRKQKQDHSSFYYLKIFAVPMIIAVVLLVLSQRRNHFDRDQFIDKKESLVGVHGMDEPLPTVHEDSGSRGSSAGQIQPPQLQGYTGVLS